MLIFGKDILIPIQKSQLDMCDNRLLALALALYSEGKAEDRCMFAAESNR